MCCEKLHWIVCFQIEDYRSRESGLGHRMEENAMRCNWIEELLSALLRVICNWEITSKSNLSFQKFDKVQ